MVSRIEMVRINKGKMAEVIPLDGRYKYSPQTLLTNGIKTEQGRYKCIKVENSTSLSLQRQTTMSDALRRLLFGTQIKGVDGPYTLTRDDINRAKVGFPEGFRRKVIYRFVEE